MRYPKKLTVLQMSFLALAAVLNIAGANLALLIRIPLYLDTLGTFLAAILFGPFYGMVPGFLSGILTGMTTDIYSLFYLPVPAPHRTRPPDFFSMKIISERKIPDSAVCVCRYFTGNDCFLLHYAFLFEGITSSGSTVMVQLFHHLGLNLTVSVFCVQLVTDFIDRTVMLALSLTVLHILPVSVLTVLKKGDRTYGSI